MNKRSAITAIEKAGALLVFPIDNRKDPASLWYHFHPRKEMRWEWDDGGDDAVGDLWHLRAALSTTREVVYTKWYRGRATYFSLELFPALLRALNPEGPQAMALSAEAREILTILEGESPLSTKELRRMTKFRDAALKELWSRLLIVAYGEVDDGSFPSLAVGSTKVLFESLWNRAFKLSVPAAEKKIDQILTGEKNLFAQYFRKLKGTGKKNASRTEKVIRFEDL